MIFDFLRHLQFFFGWTKLPYAKETWKNDKPLCSKGQKKKTIWHIPLHPKEKLKNTTWLYLLHPKDRIHKTSNDYCINCTLRTELKLQHMTFYCTLMTPKPHSCWRFRVNLKFEVQRFYRKSFRISNKKKHNTYSS